MQIATNDDICEFSFLRTQRLALPDMKQTKCTNARQFNTEFVCHLRNTRPVHEKDSNGLYHQLGNKLYV